MYCTVSHVHVPTCTCTCMCYDVIGYIRTPQWLCYIVQKKLRVSRKIY